jgi:hypothetical protein
MQRAAAVPKNTKFIYHDMVCALHKIAAYSSNGMLQTVPSCSSTAFQVPQALVLLR